MATIFTHAVVGAALAPLGPAGIPRVRLALALAVVAVVPDLDVVGLWLGIPYEHPLGHRGFSHSLLFAALLAAAVARFAFASTSARLFFALFIATASHGMLDACTNGGLGVGFLIPVSDQRFFAPVRPIPVSPIGLDASSVVGILAFEIPYVWLPALALSGVLLLGRRRGWDVKAWKLALLGAAGAAAASVCAAWFLGSSLSAPAMRDVGAPPLALGALPCVFPSASGSRVRGWIARGDSGRGAVVLAHSVRSNRLEMLGRAQFLHTAGYSVLLFDAQAHGESPGRHITFGHLESRDAAAAVDFIREQLPGQSVAYLGVSQGGAAALLGPAPLPVQALILEAVYPTLREAVVDRIGIRLGPLGHLLAPLLLLQIYPRLGVTADAIAPIEGIRNVRAPLLLIAGEKDRHTRIEESRRLFDAAPGPKTLWVVPGAAHEDFHRLARAEYERRVLDFLARARNRT